MPQISALSADVALVKTYQATSQGIEKTPYPMVSRFTSHQLAASTIEELHESIKLAGRNGWCLLKGVLDTPLVDESRAGHTNPESTTHWLCLDFDGLDAAIDVALTALRLNDIDCVVQYSNSHRLQPGLRCHVFFLVETPTPARSAKLWLQHLNMMAFKPEIGLNRLGTALRWPLDITTCQNDKLIYVAPPNLIGIEDPEPNRVVLIKGSQRHIPGSLIRFDAAGLQASTQDLLMELRKNAGMKPLRDSQFKVSGSTPYLSKPGLVNITGVKETRGFRYFNFNGGDSWGYYQPLDNPRFVYNFKGEPAVLLEEIAPEYFFDLRRRTQQERDANTVFFGYHCVERDAYYCGEWDKQANTVQTWQASSEKKVKDFLKLNSSNVPDPLPLMEMRFDPTNRAKIDFDAGFINLYTPPELTPVPCAVMPECYRKLIEHAIGTGEVYTKFVHLLAWVFQNLDKSGAAQVSHGIQGTGKGLIVEYILRPLFGAQNVKVITMAQLMQPYNSYLEQALWVVVDEAQLSVLRDHALIEANLKNAITERIIPIREMYRSVQQVRNFSNFLFCSNKPDPVSLDASDRRFHIGMYQPRRIDVNEEFINELQANVGQLAGYLSQLSVTLTEVRRQVMSEDRQKLLELSTSSVDQVAQLVLDGDYQSLVMLLPPPGAPGGALEAMELTKFKQTLAAIAKRACENNNTPDVVDREELRDILDYACGNVPKGPLKFTQFLKHHRIYCTAHETSRGIRPGIQVTWKPDMLSFARTIKQITGVEVGNSRQNSAAARPHN